MSTISVYKFKGNLYFSSKISRDNTLNNHNFQNLKLGNKGFQTIVNLIGCSFGIIL